MSQATITKFTLPIINNMSCDISYRSARKKTCQYPNGKANPAKRLIQEDDIWNLAIIDNIDFKEKSFKFGNIYDVTRGSSHATLRMAFQARLLIEIKTNPEPVIELTANTSLFGMNQSIN